MNRILAILLPLVAICSARAADPADPAALRKATERKIENYLMQGVAGRYFPGGQLVIGNKSGVIYSTSVGSFDYSGGRKVTDTDLYDLASVTKVMSTTLAVMTLYGEGRIKLSDRLGSLVPRYSGSAVADITVRDMLRHTSGMKPVIYVCELTCRPIADSVKLLSAKRDSLHTVAVDASTYVVDTFVYDNRYVSATPDSTTLFDLSPRLWVRRPLLSAIDSAVVASYQPERRGRYRYSCLNFYLLQQAIEELSGETLDKFAGSIYRRMGLTRIGYKPLEWSDIDQIAPTEYDLLMRHDTVRGYVHDEMSASLGGVCGNAGLFADGLDVASLCQMFLSGGRWNGMQIIKPEVLRLFTSEQMSPSSRVTRGLGFDKLKTEPYSTASYGHTGSTGTYFWCDPSIDLYAVLLTNGVYPSRIDKTIGGSYRKRIWELAKELRKRQ